MAHWLFKSEPEKWSWEMQKAAGRKGQQWDGVRNYQARNNMRAMQIGDQGFFYHSNAVTLEDIKANEKLAKMVLVNNSRLSVQPVADDEWAEICRMGGLKA
jgi:predicted RNA-binding protein with PUA-like domain